MEVTHLLYTPFTGLGLYNGFRGNRWLKNRIKVFKRYVVPSLQNQTDQDFVHWVSWRPEEKNNPHVRELEEYMKTVGYPYIFTYSGLCFYDDKYPEAEAMSRLALNLHRTSWELVDILKDTVLMTIQPSDDLYNKDTVKTMKNVLLNTDFQAAGYTKGYVANYLTMEVKEYNPETNPPFFTIKFNKDAFINPQGHMKHTGPYVSHEYVPQHLKYLSIPERGFLVGTHMDNVSTVFDHPYAGETVPNALLEQFGISGTEPIKREFSLRRVLFHRLPYRVKRKLRYWAEKNWILRPPFAFLYNFLRA
jgi:hypothetical protein